jgi:hypothetical protein
MRHVILYRNSQSFQEDELERKAAKQAGFIVLDKRTEVQAGDLVVARFSCVPFYSELEKDLNYLGAKLINTYEQHNYIADLQNYVADLKELTPETWSSLEDIPEEGPFILKGGTNSKKGYWKTSMFASNKKEACEVYYRLLDDSLIGRQQIYIRRFVPLYTYFEDVQGMPVTKEFRFFILDNEILCGAFYWSSHVEDMESVPSAEEVPKDFLQEAMRRIRLNGNAPRAYVLDVGLKSCGEPVVIELNELQQAGMSENDPFVFYRKLKKQLEISEKR